MFKDRIPFRNEKNIITSIYGRFAKSIPGLLIVSIALCPNQDLYHSNIYHVDWGLLADLKTPLNEPLGGKRRNDIVQIYR